MIALCSVLNFKFHGIRLPWLILKVWIINEQYVIDVPVLAAELRCEEFPSRQGQILVNAASYEYTKILDRTGTLVRVESVGPSLSLSVYRSH